MKYLFGFILLIGCENAETVSEKLKLTDSKPVEYALSDPDRVYDMPVALTEISGIAPLNENELLCIEDEHGEIYTYNVSTAKMTGTIRFGDAGDFEDIALLNGTAYILRSDGVIFRKKGNSVDELKTGLSSKDNLEGLCADSKNNRLLIASKKNSEVYAYDIATNKLQSLWSIDQKGFAPSGLAIHPVTNEIYVISSAGKQMLAVSPNGKIIQSYKLPGKHFIQPEGIAFAKNGDLYISNEGRGGTGNIVRFRYQKK